jgi:two-component system OmpR family response regulator
VHKHRAFVLNFFLEKSSASPGTLFVMKLLIVEDEARMADLLRKGLTEEGHLATCAADGAEGLALAKSYEFDVIILDVMMPRLTGYEMAKRLRAEKVGTPILMLTARDSVPDIVRGLDLGGRLPD